MGLEIEDTVAIILAVATAICLGLDFLGINSEAEQYIVFGFFIFYRFLMFLLGEVYNLIPSFTEILRNLYFIIRAIFRFLLFGNQSQAQEKKEVDEKSNEDSISPEQIDSKTQLKMQQDESTTTSVQTLQAPISSAGQSASEKEEKNKQD